MRQRNKSHKISHKPEEENKKTLKNKKIPPAVVISWL
jgi:hypothetical protein